MENEKKLSRSSGLLVPVFSLDGRENIGTFGRESIRLIDFLYRTKQKYWQMLPLGPTSRNSDNSPYAVKSAFALNPLYISLEWLVEDGLLTKADLPQKDNADDISYDKVTKEKFTALNKAYQNAKSKKLPNDFYKFCIEHKDWVNDYAYYEVLSEKTGTSWDKWEPQYKFRLPGWENRLKSEYGDEIQAQKYYQYLTYKHFDILKKYAKSKGIDFVGDIPIYMGYDSADVWAHRENYELDKNGRPIRYPGVPDQTWKDLVLYNWSALEKTNYEPLMKKFEAALKLYSGGLRADHTRGYEYYWAIFADSMNPGNGTWERGGGWEFFKIFREKYKDVTLISEDIGDIPYGVRRFLDTYGFKSMKVVPYGDFEYGRDNDHTPCQYKENQIAYTATHDTPPIKGWYNFSNYEQKKALGKYCKCDNDNFIHWAVVRETSDSNAGIVIFQAQDIMGKDEKTTTNRPGETGCWTWKMKADELYIPYISTTLGRVTENSRRAIKRDKGLEFFILPGDIQKNYNINKEVAITK